MRTESKGAEQKKVKVRFLDSVAGLADKDRGRLDLKYLKIRAELESRKNRPTDAQISAYIASLKAADGYSDPAMGFPKDWSFKPGDVRKINQDTAEKWEACGLVEIVDEASPALIEQ